VIRARRDQQDRGHGGQPEGDEEEVCLQLRGRGEALAERDRKQEREQDLDAREGNAKLVQQLDQLAADALLLALPV